jgi:hypothetical protein
LLLVPDDTAYVHNRLLDLVPLFRALYRLLRARKQDIFHPIKHWQGMLYRTCRGLRYTSNHTTPQQLNTNTKRERANTSSDAFWQLWVVQNSRKIRL